MRRYVFVRVGNSILMVLVVMSIIFAVVRALPGDPTSFFVNEAMPQADIMTQRSRWALDQPLQLQYLHYMKNMITFDFGRSFSAGVTVWEILGDKLANTLVLMAPALAMIVTLGAAGGALAGWRRGSKYEQSGVVLALLFRSVPDFFLALVALLVFAFSLKWFPSGGMVSPGTNLSFWEQVISWDFAAHMALPLLVIVANRVSSTFMLMRSSMIEVLGEEFLETLKAKGLSESQLVRRAARNALLPLVTYVGVMVPFLLEGQVVLENVFAWPGIGREIVHAVVNQDYPLMQGAFFLFAVTIVVMNLAVDMLYGYLDPRVRYA